MKFVLTALALAVSLPLVAGGQSPPVPAGARARVTAPSSSAERHATMIMDARSDSMAFTLPGGWRTLWFADLQTLEAGIAKGAHLARDGGVDPSLPFLVGSVVGFAASDRCLPRYLSDYSDRLGGPAQSALSDGIALGTFAVAIGSAVGTRHRTISDSAWRCPLGPFAPPIR